ncbi:MAG: hypothetical protein KME15_14260 [Drouetiella hepatica Uher 2000/2452]|jgi:hypothetical protein|uniref:Uncharacterized protein n=1 Tax=Drouetiella hepatica Uher 2000/2452 TaxID=904376 RepID=A0A951QDP0_9CYAN|nr:hypothetical protein [Drouetiella hepatica Uher 2000/2452]
MLYSDQLRPWVVYRLLPNCQRLMMERFRNRNNAEDYVRIMRQMQPDAQFEIVFESSPKLPGELSSFEQGRYEEGRSLPIYLRTNRFLER